MSKSICCQCPFSQWLRYWVDVVYIFRVRTILVQIYKYIYICFLYRIFFCIEWFLVFSFMNVKIHEGQKTKSWFSFLPVTFERHGISKIPQNHVIALEISFWKHIARLATHYWSHRNHQNVFAPWKTTVTELQSKPNDTSRTNQSKSKVHIR